MCYKDELRTRLHDHPNDDSIQEQVKIVNETSKKLNEANNKNLKNCNDDEKIKKLSHTLSQSIQIMDEKSEEIKSNEPNMKLSLIETLHQDYYKKPFGRKLLNIIDKVKNALIAIALLSITIGRVFYDVFSNNPSTLFTSDRQRLVNAIGSIKDKMPEIKIETAKINPLYKQYYYP